MTAPGSPRAGSTPAPNPSFRVVRGATDLPGKVVLAGHAALDPADVEDAKRQHPAEDLSSYAVRRDLEFLGQANAAGYLAALPRDPAQQFSVLRGVIAPHRQACLWHWRRAYPVDGDGDLDGGPYYSVAFHPPVPKGWWKPNRTMLPGVGWLLNPPTSQPDYAVGVPCTAAATPVPEAALLPDLVLRNPRRDLLIPHRRSKQLAAYDLPDWTLTTKDDPANTGSTGSDLSPAHYRTLDRLLRGPLRDVLAYGWQLPLFELRLSFATLTVCRNGYPRSDLELDGLLWAVGRAGDALHEACWPETRPQPFEVPVAPADWPRTGGAWSGRVPSEAWLAPLRALAERYRLTLEDPEAYARAYPSTMVPGRPFAVLRGPLPHVGEPGRIVFHCEAPLSSGNLGRTAVLVAARGAAPTPPGGERSSGTGLTTAVGGDVLAVWQGRNSGKRGDLGDTDALLAAAAEIATSRRHS